MFTSILMRALTAALILIVLLVIVLPAIMLNSARHGEPTPAEAAARLTNGKIAFDIGTAEGVAIGVAQSDGSDYRNLTPGSTFARFPAWSPDGEEIAFASEYGISVMAADGTNVRNLAAGGSSPAWSPDGARIAFWGQSAAGVVLHLVDADGSNVTPVDEVQATILGMSWSPDGSRIAFMRERDANYDIYLTNPDGSNQTRLTDDPGFDGDPDWSPDGSKIAFASQRASYSAIWVMNADGSDQRPLIPVHRCSATPTPPPPPETPRACGGDDSPAWAADGSQIAYSSYVENGGSDIFIVNADGSGERRLTNTASSESFPDWQPVLPGTKLTATPGPAVTSVLATATPCPSATPEDTLSLTPTEPPPIQLTPSPSPTIGPTPEYTPAVIFTPSLAEEPTTPSATPAPSIPIVSASPTIEPPVEGTGTPSPTATPCQSEPGQNHRW